jgi:hydroxyacylglutathione hydrolase
MGYHFEVIRVRNDHCGSNAYIIPAQDCRSALVIDPADVETGSIPARLAASGITKVLVALTHEHFDHMSGVNRLREQFATDVIASSQCSQSITDPKRNLSRYTIGMDIRCDAANILWNEDHPEFIWEDIHIGCVRAPGHSPGSVVLTVDTHLFSGDTLIPGVPTVVKLPGGNRPALEATVEDVLARFPPDTIVHPGHGESFRLSTIDPAIVLRRKVRGASDASI